MKANFFKLFALLFTTAIYAQSGHIMQGVGAVNMSMGGASTAQPLDISGALHWNPAAVSTFDSKILKFDLGLFFSSPELRGSLPPGMMGPGSPGVSGVTEDDRGVSFMPALAMVWGKPESKHTFGVSAFGISGFGVTFPEEANNPMNPNFNPNENSNPINYPQQANGFGHIESDYMLLQIGFTWAYELSDKFSIGVQPNIDYAALELMPNPTANPNSAGYPSTNKASAIGFGAQFGVFFDSGSGFKLGASYKTTQSFGDFEFENTYLDNSTSTNEFNMDYPSILSFGLGYSTGDIDFALDYRNVNYENTDGFSKTGWTSTASVAGFGWENISIISAGLQYKGIDKLPLRFGYTYSSNPINEKVAFFNIPATAIIKNAFQFGLSYQVNDKLNFDGVYHYGTSGDATSGQMLSPMMAGPGNPYGAIPGSSVSYEMKTSMIMVGFSYNFINN
ncbi:OmpP1/FadL family transporter [Pontimicrobium aquaticum]|uniref:Hydrocarbon degradation protein n=1 Tax=Pontimicrobium aquaticum TaxID=2565367 RepID=A0A4U0EQP0_9FLAO|nr:outer membrane protein transport protein [Pontimicrobium aquaticum]TJY33997.1 hydrocarbon degradation protein [Pontimicrobium aquaticum]